MCPQLLSKPKFSGVEKIKTIGSTYMAATGLNVTPGPECAQARFHTHALVFTHVHTQTHDLDAPGRPCWIQSDPLIVRSKPPLSSFHQSSCLIIDEQARNNRPFHLVSERWNCFWQPELIFNQLVIFHLWSQNRMKLRHQSIYCCPNTFGGFVWVSP